MSRAEEWAKRNSMAEAERGACQTARPQWSRRHGQFQLTGAPHEAMVSNDGKLMIKPTSEKMEDHEAWSLGRWLVETFGE